MQYYTMTTNAGDESVAQAIQTGSTTVFTQIAVGDGSGAYYEPAKTQTTLRREVWRGAAVVSRDPNNLKRVIIAATIPATVGGFTVREAGVFDAANTMMIVSKLPLSEKVSPDSGASTDLVIRLYAEVTDAGAVAITVDPSAIQAFKSDVDAAAAKAAEDLEGHKSDSVAHMTQTNKDTLAAAVQSAAIGGTPVTKVGTNLQFPAYPVSLPANEGNSDTVDGLHAAAFLKAADSAPVKIQSAAPADTTALWAW